MSRPAIHTACRHCGLDIEGVSPFRAGQWRDRGNNARCNDGAHDHAPVPAGAAPAKLGPVAEAAIRVRGPRPFTVIGIYPGSDPRETFIDHTYARDGAHAGGLIAEARGGDGPDVVIVAVFAGHLEDAL